MTEQRESDRIRTFLLGTILLNGGATVITCVVTDVSWGGARIRMPPSLPVPVTFDLYISHHDTTYPVELRWRSGDEIGVRFRSISNVPLSALDDGAGRLASVTSSRETTR